MKVGDVLVEKNTLTVFHIMTRDRTNKLKEICIHKNIKKLAFPKHGMGLDK